MAAHPYSETAAYREGVVAAMTRTAGLPSVLEGVSPAASCVRYSHLALACRDVEKSVDFYRKLGFARVSETDSSNIVRLRHVSNGLDLHLVSATDTAVEGNVLMDTPTLKHAGHTHASWTVPSVPGVKELLSSIGVEVGAWLSRGGGGGGGCSYLPTPPPATLPHFPPPLALWHAQHARSVCARRGPHDTGAGAQRWRRRASLGRRYAAAHWRRQAPRPRWHPCARAVCVTGGVVRARAWIQPSRDEVRVRVGVV